MSSTVGTESFCPNYEQPDHMCRGPDINPAGHTLCESYTHRARPFHISNYPAAVLGNTCQTEVMGQSCVCWKQLIVWTEFTKNLRTIIVVVFLYTCRNLNCDFGIKTYSYAQEWQKQQQKIPDQSYIAGLDTKVVAKFWQYLRPR